MRKLFLRALSLLGSVAGVLALLRLLPPSWREKLSEAPGFAMVWMMEKMPDD
jgi:hypothetical protein